MKKITKEEFIKEISPYFMFSHDILTKSRENGEKNGKTAELDLGAGAEWPIEKFVRNLKDKNNE